MIVELTQEQWNELCELTIDNLQTPLPYILSLQNKWWKTQLGFIPTRVDRIEGKKFQITK